MRLQHQRNIGGRSHSRVRHSEAAQFKTQGNLDPKVFLLTTPKGAWEDRDPVKETAQRVVT